MSVSTEAIAKKAIWPLLAIGALGIFFRFINITENQFIYYDEGMWLNFARDFVRHVETHPPDSLAKLWFYLNAAMHLSLASAKSLWAFISIVRAFFVGEEGWFFNRLVSAVCGSLTLGVVYLFARRYFNSIVVGLLSAAVLSMLPSHLYYSRLALQEALSTFFFTLGLYLYLFPRQLNYRTYISGIVLSLCYFSNYRMIIVPALVLFSEIIVSLSKKEKMQISTFCVNAATFVFIVLVVGSIDNARNLSITTAWIGRQAAMAQGGFDPVSLLSYPYYAFKLETLPFGFLFFGNVYFILKKKWTCIFPFALSLLVMIIFTFAQDKGVRYICAVMPMMAVSVAVLVDYAYRNIYQEKLKRVVIGCVCLMFVWQGAKAVEIANFKNDYEQSMVELKAQRVYSRIVSSQQMIHKMYTPQYQGVVEVPKNVQAFFALRARGFRYLMLDPQAFVSKTKDDIRFHTQLTGYLNFIRQNIRPIKTYPHFNQPMLERFVLEHNVSLKQSLAFLKANEDGNLGKLYLYDMDHCMVLLQEGFKRLKERE